DQGTIRGAAALAAASPPDLAVAQTHIAAVRSDLIDARIDARADLSRVRTDLVDVRALLRPHVRILTPTLLTGLPPRRAPLPDGRHRLPNLTPPDTRPLWVRYESAPAGAAQMIARTRGLRIMGAVVRDGPFSAGQTVPPADESGTV